MFHRTCSPCCVRGASAGSTVDIDSDGGESEEKGEPTAEDLPVFPDGSIPEKDLSTNVKKEEKEWNERDSGNKRYLNWRYPWENQPKKDDDFVVRRRKRKIFCRTGFDLAVFPNGKIRGVINPSSRYALLEFESAGYGEELRIRGVSTGFYVTMTNKGRIIGQPSPEHRGTIWVETRIQSSPYFAFLSLEYAHLGYYLALKRSGKPKEGSKTYRKYPQKAISFLSRIIPES